MSGKTAHSNGRAPILVVEDDPHLAQVIEDILRAEGHPLVIHAGTLAEARKKLSESPRMLVLDWNLPDGEGVELIQDIRSNLRLSHIPILMITGRDKIHEKVTGFNQGADDYLTKPFAEAELCARISALLRRISRDRGASPLTGLPGNVRIEEEVSKRLAKKLIFDAVYCDIDRFKPFNDRYGFAKGDEAIRVLADCLLEAANPDDFVGHIGGDDFVSLLPAGQGEAYAAKVVESFARRARNLHDKTDRERGYFEAKDRHDVPQKMPLLSVTAAVVSTAVRHVRRYAELAQAAAEVKSAARKAGESIRSEKRLDGIRS